MLGKTALPSAAGHCLEPVDEVDDIVEAATGTGSDATPGDCDGQMGLAGAGTADQHDVACWAMKPPPARSLTSVWLIGVPVELEVGDLLGEWQRGDDEPVT